LANNCVTAASDENPPLDPRACNANSAQLSRTATALDDLAALGCAILVRGLRRKEVCYTARR
jgi:hypothetical protein